MGDWMSKAMIQPTSDRMGPGCVTISMFVNPRVTIWLSSKKSWLRISGQLDHANVIAWIFLSNDHSDLVYSHPFSLPEILLNLDIYIACGVGPPAQNPSLDGLSIGGLGSRFMRLTLDESDSPSYAPIFFLASHDSSF